MKTTLKHSVHKGLKRQYDNIRYGCLLRICRSYQSQKHELTNIWILDRIIHFYLSRNQWNAYRQIDKRSSHFDKIRKIRIYKPVY